MGIIIAMKVSAADGIVGQVAPKKLLYHPHVAASFDRLVPRAGGAGLILGLTLY
jgi:hypothetical protein